MSCQFADNYWMCLMNSLSVHMSSSFALDPATWWTELGCGVRSRTAECFLIFCLQGLSLPIWGFEAGLGCLWLCILLVMLEFIFSHVIICFLPCPWGFLSGSCILFLDDFIVGLHWAIWSRWGFFVVDCWISASSLWSTFSPSVFFDLLRSVAFGGVGFS